MRTVVQIELNDANEIKAFGDFTNVLERYRAGEVFGQTGEQEPPAPQEPPPAQDEAVVAHIDDTGVTKPVKPTELQAAAQAYAKKHGLDAALKIVKEFGATRVGEIKDPKMMAALYERFTK